MSENIQHKILTHVKSQGYRPKKRRQLAKELNLAGDAEYEMFKEGLGTLMSEGRVMYGDGGTIVVPASHQRRDELVGTYRQNKRGFGFVVPSDTTSHEDLYIAPGDNAGAITGDLVRAKITSKAHRDGKPMWSGQIVEVLQRKNKRFVGSLGKLRGQWVVYPDGNILIEPILAPDAASRHIKPGTKVVVELTSFPGDREPTGSAAGSAQFDLDTLAQGVITEVLGAAGEKDVDLKSVIVQYNLPAEFPDGVRDEAREAVDTFDPEEERERRLDLTDEVIATIDPVDAKDFDDAISLRRTPDGDWELGVHIADVSTFVREGTAMDEEARERGNSTYFPGYVIPMLPEVLSNGVCSLQEGVPRLTKSAFITLDAETAEPISTRFANTIIKSRKRLRYEEAQAIIDNKQEIPHPEGAKRLADYPAEVVKLLREMDELARRIQKRRRAAGQLVLDLPEVDLVLNEEGKVVDAVAEDVSFTHTVIEMFMVEANEAVARLLTAVGVPFLRRIHPEPEMQDNERLRHFAQVTGYKLPKEMDRKALQQLLESVKGKPEAFAINLSVLKSLSRAEYSPEEVGHYALASEDYAHFTSPIRRYADLTIHRLLDAYFEASNADFRRGAIGRPKGGRKSGKLEIEDVPTHDELVELGKHLSFTERRSEDAERELRQVKILTLLQDHVGDEFDGVVTGITKFGIFVQLGAYLVDGLIRYEDLMDDYWDVDERAGIVKGRRTGYRIGIGDTVKARIVKVDLPRRELDLAIVQLLARSRHGRAYGEQDQQQQQGAGGKKKHRKGTGGKPKQLSSSAGGTPRQPPSHRGRSRHQQLRRDRRGRRH
jgi:ribonuclease R